MWYDEHDLERDLEFDNKELTEKEKIYNSLQALRSEFTERISVLFKRIERINNETNEINETNEKPSFPIGYDPEGCWTIINTSGLWEVSKMELTLSRDSDGGIIPAKNPSLYKGYSFTTKEQAQNKADGLNALKELVFAIYDENLIMEEESSLDKFHYEFKLDYHSGSPYSSLFEAPAFSHPRKLWMKNGIQGNVIARVGKDKIKLALEWGL